MKKKNGISVGTILILSLSLGVVTLTFLFLLVISGSDFGRMENQKADERPAEESPAVVMDEKAEDAQRDSRGADAETLPEESGDPIQIALSFAGDITVTRGMQETLMINDHEYDFTRAFAGISGAFGEADLSIATLETLISTMAPYDTYNAPPDLLEALKAIGIHHLNLATEHMMDLGFDGLKATKLEVTRLGMEYSGYLSQSELEGIISVNGVKIAVLAYTYGLSDEGRVLTGKSGLKEIPIFSIQKVLEGIRTVRAQGADLVVVLPHWGTKNVETVTEGMRKTAQQMAEAGADLIIGTHPNVVSEAGFIETKRADGRMHETLVCYSIGGLLTEARNDDNAAGMILNVGIEYDPGTRSCRIRNCRPIPLYIYQDRINDRRIWRALNVLDEEQLGQVSETVREKAAGAMARVKSMTGDIER